MSPWVKGLFLKVLPRLLFMQRPQDQNQLGSRYKKVRFNVVASWNFYFVLCWSATCSQQKGLAGTGSETLLQQNRPVLNRACLLTQNDDLT